MSKFAIISIGVFILGMVGLFFITDLCEKYSTLRHSVIIGSLIITIVGSLMLWVEWGGKGK